jgi:hypothetical protein
MQALVKQAAWSGPASASRFTAARTDPGGSAARPRRSRAQGARGQLTVHRDGFGFVDVGTEEDVFVPPHEAGARSTVTG